MTEAAMVVAHPDDETIWGGGTILRNVHWNWFVAALTRADDTERAPKFYDALKELKASGSMGNLDDGPEQNPLDEKTVMKEILRLIPEKNYDLIITHDPRNGEYTRHKRHEEVGTALIQLWVTGKIKTKHFWTFAYSDQGSLKYPIPEKNVDNTIKIRRDDFITKQKIITDVYGFKRESFEFRSLSRKETYRCFETTKDALNYLQKG